MITDIDKNSEDISLEGTNIKSEDESLHLSNAFSGFKAFL